MEKDQTNDSAAASGMLAGKLGWFRGVGNSQRPLIRSGDWIETDPIRGDLRPGELAVFCGERYLICHRVLWRKRERGTTWYFFKGDAENFADGWYPDYRVLAKVKAISGRPVSSKSFQLKSFALFAITLLRTLAIRVAFARPWGPPLGRLRRSLSAYLSV